jgi:15-cis-phytoene synthase
MVPEHAAALSPDQAFALLHVPGSKRAAVAALWLLDTILGRVVASTSQPLVGQMRLTWWHDTLSALTAHTHYAQPELDSLAANVIGKGGIAAHDLAALVEGWEALLEPMPLENTALSDHAALRGAWVFELSARLLGTSFDNAAGGGWALADFGFRCSDPQTVSRALDMARQKFGQARLHRLPRPLRILARLAAADVVASQRQPRTLWRLMRSLA